MSPDAETREHAAPDGEYFAPADRALSTVTGTFEGGWIATCLLLVVLGAGGFALAVGGEPTRTWTTVWANFLFWTALAQAGVMFGAVLQTAKGHWGKGFRRLAEGMGAFLPASFLLFLLLAWFGAEHVFPWLGPVEGHVNREWLTLGGVRWRNTAGLLLLYGLSFWYLRLALRPDAPLIADRVDGWRRSLVEWIGRGWRGDAEELERSRRLLGQLSPALILVWAAVFTLLSYDLIMSLMPGFLSVIWGPYYFVGGWLSMLALVGIFAWRYRARFDLGETWGRWEFHDLGKLTFAFVIFWAYMWWSQFLVIWYGNLGRETVFFEQRIGGPGSSVYWLQMVLIFGLPFALLLGRRPKMKPGWLAFVSAIVLIGFWLERHLLVAPSVLEGGLAFGWIEVAVSLGFAGLFGLCYAVFSSTFPKLPIRETLPGDAATGP